MTIVVGTAGHIDHGKTTLLRALTGIDADRLPEERRRGMTIDLGYAHITLADGPAIDFIDVPGHDRLVGNMLVGAGEIDAALLVVAADDGPRAQTLEHLALLDALGIGHGLVVITKADVVPEERVGEVLLAVERLLEATTLAGSPVIVASGVDGSGLDDVRSTLATVASAVAAPERPPALSIDRVFPVRGRGPVVTGTLRGGPLARGDRLRLLPGGREVRVREIQVHGSPVESVTHGGRTALNISGADPDALHRGAVLTADPEIVATSRVLVSFSREVADRTRGRLHAGTAAADVAVGRSGRDGLRLPDGRIAGMLRLSEPLALRPGDAMVLRRGPGERPLDALVIDPEPARSLSRRRQTPERVAALAMATTPETRARARLELHGALGTRLAPDVTAAGRAVGLDAVDPAAGLDVVRAAVVRTLRRLVTVRRADAVAAAGQVVDALVDEGSLVRDGDRLSKPGVATPIDVEGEAAMARLEAALTGATPPSLEAAMRDTGCDRAGLAALERAGRVVRLDADLAYAMATYRDLAATALRLAAREPLTPAAFRDATGTSRKYVMPILEDLDRRAILRKTPAGHVLGPRAPVTR